MQKSDGGGQWPVTKRIKWFLDYYGIRLVAILVIIGVAIYMIKSVFWSAPAADVRVLMLTDTVTDQMTLQYEQDIADLTGATAEVVVYHPNDMYGKQAFATKVGTDVVDLVIAPEEESRMLAENGFLLSYAQISGGEVYMGVSRSAREGKALQTAMQYLEQKLSDTGRVRT